MVDCFLRLSNVGGAGKFDGTDLAAPHQLFGLALVYDGMYATSIPVFATNPRHSSETRPRDVQRRQLQSRRLLA
jgi:hypothetical protein